MTFHRNRKVQIIFLITFLSLFFSYGLPDKVYSQAEPCSKPRVNITLMSMEIHNDVFDVANKAYPKIPDEARIQQIRKWVSEELINNSPDTQFIENCGNCDYTFYYGILAMGMGDDIEVRKGVFVSKYVGLCMISGLKNNNACRIPGWLLQVEVTKDRDLHYLIRRNIAAYGDIGALIDEHEESHPVPPRGPKLEVTQKQDFVSPLKNERKLEIRMHVKNCKGEEVFDRNHGQHVFVHPCKMGERGEVKATQGFPQGGGQYCILGNLHLKIQKPVGASATYDLKKGVKPGEEKIKIKTCGRDKMDKQETEINIYGLEISAVPRQKKVDSGDKTKIDITLLKISKDGDKKPAIGQEIELKIQGLVDGQVTPKEKIVTNQKGKAILNYVAGKKDKQVTFKVKFQPEGFDEYVEDECTVDVVCQQWKAEITFHHIVKHFDEQTSADRNVTLTIKARLKPRRKAEQISARRDPAMDAINAIRKQLKSGMYGKHLDPKQLAQMEGAIKRLEQQAMDVGEIHNYASFGAQVVLMDLFNRTDIKNLSGVKIMEKWHWSAQKSGQMPLNIGLNTSASHGHYQVDVGTMDPEGNDQGDVPISYQYQASKNSQPPLSSDFQCSGFIPVKDALLTLNLFVKVPKAKLAFKEDQDVLSGSYSWKESTTARPAVGHDAFGPDCKENFPLLLPSMNALTWKFERTCK